MFYRVYYQIPDQHINYVLVEADDDDKATNHFFNHRKVQPQLQGASTSRPSWPQKSRSTACEYAILRRRINQTSGSK